MEETFINALFRALDIATGTAPRTVSITFVTYQQHGTFGKKIFSYCAAPADPIDFTILLVQGAKWAYPSERHYLSWLVIKVSASWPISYQESTVQHISPRYFTALSLWLFSFPLSVLAHHSPCFLLIHTSTRLHTTYLFANGTFLSKHLDQLPWPLVSTRALFLSCGYLRSGWCI